MQDTNQFVHVTKDGEVEILDRAKAGIEIHHRDTDSEQVVNAIGDALRYGSRAERRRKVNLGDGKDGGAIKLSRQERNRRNAQRRVAKQARKKGKR